ncbi:MAG: thiamine-phosphate synthase family protein, partial [Sulfolobaceae archaeon]
MFKSPLDMITEILIPTLRAIEAKRLRQLGMSQNKIAMLLGVTQPAIKQYLDESEENLYSKLIDLGLSKEEIEEFLQNITELLLKGDQKAVMSYLTIFGLSSLSYLKFCRYHKKIDSNIPNDCEICRDLYRESEEELMNIAVLMLENRIVTPLIPEVLSNIAFAKRNARSEKDIIAIPGRITKVFEIPKASSKPAWGGSKHLALVLLNVMKISPEVRAV